MSLTKITSDGITDGSIVNADLHSAANIAKSKLASLDIVNADVNASAAIAGSKISPTFTSAISQSDSGGASNTFATNIQINTTFPSISLNDTDSENDFHIQNQNGLFAIKDTDAAANRLTISSAGVTTIAGNLDVGAGIDVTGNVVATGNIEINSAYPIIKLTDTNNNDDFEIRNADGIFIVRDATNSVDRLSINSSGSASITGSLFVSSNITTSGTVDGRDLAADGTKLDGIESSATADQTASEIVALIADQTIQPSILAMQDNEKVLLGTQNDMQLYHDGNHNLILGSPTVLIKNQSNNESYIRCTENAQVELYHNNTKRIETTSSGATVTGNIGVSGTVDGRDVASDGSKLDGIASGANNITNNNQLSNGAGYVTSSNQQLSKAFVSFNGYNGSIRADYGVSSVSYNAEGKYQINFSPGIGSANYTAVSACSGRGNVNTANNNSMIHTTMPGNQGGTQISNPSSGSMRLVVLHPANERTQNTSYVSVIVFDT